MDIQKEKCITVELKRSCLAQLNWKGNIMAKLVKTIFGGLTAPLRVFGPDAPDVSEPPLLRAPSLEMQTVGSSEEEEDSFDVHIPPCSSKRGLLSKWTNYLHGWQDRYFNVADGLLSYYKSEVDTKYGCRGSVSLQRAIITVSLPRELSKQAFQ